MSEKNYVVNVKTKVGTIFTVRGDSAEELNGNIQNAIVNSTHDFVAALEEQLIGSSSVPTQHVAQPVVQAAPTAVEAITAIGGTVVSEQPVAPSFAPVPPPTQAAPAGGVDVIEDRWGNKWTYGRADAPVCPNGPMVLKQGINKSGGSYAGWFDPAGGPRWQGAKVPSEAQTPPKWGVKV
jgi:hypothetical protein